MTAQNRVAGVCYLKANGKQLTLGGAFTVSPSKVEREGVVGMSGVAGYKETPVIPYIEGEVITTADLDIEELDAFVGGTVTAELANGKNYVLTQAWRAGRSEIDGVEGKLPVRFEGVTCEQF